METLTVDLGDRSYPIFIGGGLLERAELPEPYLGDGRIVVVSNETVAPLYLERVTALFGASFGAAIILPDGEKHKTLDNINRIYDRLLELKCDRKTTLVALGGGVIGDMAGFAAATYQRGIGYIQLPTSLLAQVDSSVGGKTGVNHPRGKNMIGAFYQPRCVLIDTTVLSTLPQREVKAGLAEVLKYGLIDDAEFFAWLAAQSESLLALDPDQLGHAISICCQSKAAIVAKDEKEAGVRALLNLGHTFGHAIETAAGYGNWLHGETVAMGMVMAADLSLRKDWIGASTAAEIRTVLEENYGMPVIPPADIRVEDYLDLMASDKKAERGRIRFILLRAIGQAVLEGNVEPELLEQTLTAGDQLCRNP